MKQTRQNKAQILEKASRVFYRHGYRATGVDFIAKEAGITKATLYHHFTNKNALMEESLAHLSAFHRAGYIRAWSGKGLTPECKLTVLFDVMHTFFQDKECYGCPFINAAGEFTDRNSRARIICEAHYAFLMNELESFARQAKLRKPRQLAERIAGCIAGAYTGWYVAGLKDAAKQAKLSAELLIAHHRK